MFLDAEPTIFQNAEALRYRMTAAETLLWEHLKNNQLGIKFRRQHPIGFYIADFCCHKYQLIIELDGDIHNIPEIAANDIVRQTHLEENGIKFLRFKNEQILINLKKF